MWKTLTQTAERADVIVFFDRPVEQVTGVMIVVLDNVPIHRSEMMREKQAEWGNKCRSLLYLPPYSLVGAGTAARS